MAVWLQAKVREPGHGLWSRLNSDPLCDIYADCDVTLCSP